MINQISPSRLPTIYSVYFKLILIKFFLPKNILFNKNTIDISPFIHVLWAAFYVKVVENLNHSQNIYQIFISFSNQSSQINESHNDWGYAFIGFKLPMLSLNWGIPEKKGY